MKRIRFLTLKYDERGPGEGWSHVPRVAHLDDGGEHAEGDAVQQERVNLDVHRGTAAQMPVEEKSYGSKGKNLSIYNPAGGMLSSRVTKPRRIAMFVQRIHLRLAGFILFGFIVDCQTSVICSAGSFSRLKCDNVLSTSAPNYIGCSIPIYPYESAFLIS